MGSRVNLHASVFLIGVVDRLQALGIPHRHEEFEGTHSAIDWRLDESLPYLVDALKNAPEEATL